VEDRWAADRDATGAVVFSLGLTDADGDDVFACTCASCGKDLAVEPADNKAPDPEFPVREGYTLGAIRYRCMECKKANVCQRCFEAGADEVDDQRAHRFHPMSKERDHPIWLHLQVRLKFVRQF
jgi:hypothetical protein